MNPIQLKDDGEEHLHVVASMARKAANVPLFFPILQKMDDLQERQHDAALPEIKTHLFFCSDRRAAGIPACQSLLLILASDIESNPGPSTYTCPICNTVITNRMFC